MKLRIFIIFTIFMCMITESQVFAATLINYGTAQGYLTAPISGAQRNTPEEYIFSVDDKKFVLLDSFINSLDPSKNEFFVMAYDFYGGHDFDSLDLSTCQFDPTKISNVGYFLNNDFKTTGNAGNKMPQGIIDNINYQHEWSTEPMLIGQTEYKFTAGISLLAQVELVAYINKIGLFDELPASTWGWWLRTKRKEAPSILCVLGNASGNVFGTTSATGTNKATPPLRPVFYLNNDFFKKVKISITPSENNTSFVRSQIFNNYRREDLAQAGYSQAELDMLFAPIPPTASNVLVETDNIIVNHNKVYMPLVEGVTVECNFNYSDVNNVQEKDSVYKWEIGTKNVSTGIIAWSLLDVTSKQCTLGDATAGKYIRASVFPSNGTTISTKSKLSTNELGPVLVGNVPIAQNVRILGQLGIGSDLSGAYDFIDDVNSEGVSLFEWYVGDSNSGSFSKIDTENSKTMIIKDNLLGKYIKLAVTPKSTAGAKNVGIQVLSPIIGPIISRKSAAVSEFLVADRTNILILLRKYSDILDSRLNTISNDQLIAVGNAVLLSPKNDFISLSNFVTTAIDNSFPAIPITIINQGGNSSGSGSGGGGGTTKLVVTGPKETSAPPKVVIAQEMPDVTKSDGEKTLIDENLTFPDLDTVLWAKDDIEFLARKGLMKGMPDGNFAPKSRLLFIDFIKLIIDSFGLLDTNAQCEYLDVKKTQWFYPYAASAKARKLANGYSDAIFGVNRELNRQDMVTVLDRVASEVRIKLQNVSEPNNFIDESDISDYAKESVKVLSQSGIINGFEDGSFGPQKFVTRAMTASVIRRLLSIME